MVSPTRVSATSLIWAVMKPISPGPSSLQLLDLGAEAADAVDQVGGAGGHELDLLALADGAVDDADEDDDAEIGVVPAVDQHRLQGRVAVALGRRDLVDDRLQHLVDADAGLGAGEHGLRRVEADDLLDLLPDPLGVGGGEVDLVDHRHDLMVVLDRLVDVGQRLRLDALRRVDDQQRAFAGGEAPRHLIGEVDVAGRVHQVQLVAACHSSRTVCALMVIPRSCSMSILSSIWPCGHLALGEPAGALDQPVGERRLAMVDMGDDREIADVARCLSFAAAR